MLEQSQVDQGAGLTPQRQGRESGEQHQAGGAKVLLAGDWAQLSAVEAGGAFSMLVRDRDIAPELTDVRRFRNDWEKAASVRLRIGDTRGLDDYERHGRIVDGDRDEVLAAL